MLPLYFTQDYCLCHEFNHLVHTETPAADMDFAAMMLAFSSK